MQRHALTITQGMLSLVAASCVSAADFTIAPTNVSAIYRWSVHVGSTGAQINPTLHLMRGSTYTFAVSTSSLHPFWIKTESSTGSSNAYTGAGLSANGVSTSTTITFDVPPDAPDALFYNCGNHSSMTGAIEISIFADGFGA